MNLITQVVDNLIKRIHILELENEKFKIELKRWENIENERLKLMTNQQAIFETEDEWR